MGLFSGLGKFLFGRKPKTVQAPLMTPQQSAEQKQLLDIINQYLTKHPIGEQVSSFDPYAEEAIGRFEEGLPSIFERYNQLGGQSRINPAEMAAIYGAQSNLFRGLASDEATFDRNALMQDRQFLQSLFSPAFGRQFENVIQPGTPGLFGALAGGLGSAAAQRAVPRI